MLLHTLNNNTNNPESQMRMDRLEKIFKISAESLYIVGILHQVLPEPII
jgi:hypothetical protein